MRQQYIPVLLLIALGYPAFTAFMLLTGADAGTYNIWIRSIETLIIAFLLLATTRRVRSANVALWPVVLFLTIYAVRLFYDVVILDILMIFQTPLYALGYFVGLTFLPVLAILALFKEPDLRALNGWLVAVLAVSNILLLFYALSRGVQGDAGIFSGRIEERGDIEGTAVLGPLWFGFCGAALGAVLVGLQASVVKSSNAVRIAGLALSMICIANVLFSASRGPVVAFLFAFLCLLLKLLGGGKFAGKRGSRWGAWATVLAVAGSIAWVLSNLQGDIFLFDRFTMMFNDRQAGILEERDYIRIAGWNDFLSSPLFGRSYVVSHENASAHNLVLDSLISTGVFGTVFFLAALWKTGTSIWALLDGKRGAAGVALAMMTIVVSVMAMTSGSIGQSPEFWIFSSLVIVVAASDARPKPSRLPARNRG
jgi:hypothetical protein